MIIGLRAADVGCGRAWQEGAIGLMDLLIELNFPNPVDRRADLFDRDRELRVLQDTLRSATRRPVVVMGERVMGKTSLLNIVAEWARSEQQCVVLKLPHANTRNEFAEEILGGIAAGAGLSLSQLGLRDGAGRFRQATVVELVKAAETLCAHRPDTRFLLCLDELDSMLAKCRDDAAVQDILAFVLHLVDETSLPIRFLFTATRMVPPVLNSPGSSFLSSARIVPLTPWTFAESREFVGWLFQGTVELDEAAHEQLFIAAGGHPYLTKAVLQMFQERQVGEAPANPVRAERIRAAVATAATSAELGFTLENIVRVHFSDQERRILRQAATAGGLLGAATLGALDGESAEAAGSLLRRSYLRGETGGYQQAFGLLAEWLLVRFGAPSWTGGPGSPDLRLAPPTLLVDDTRQRIFLGDQELHVTPQEYRFLRCLAAHAGSVIGRRAVAAEVWPGESFGSVREGRLDTLVHRLRDEFRRVLGDGPDYVETRRGRGFYLSADIVRRPTGEE